MNIAERLELALERAGKKQRDLCKEIGISDAQFSNWKKRNSISKKYIKQVADFLDVSVEFLLGYDKMDFNEIPLHKMCECGISKNIDREVKMIAVPEMFAKEGNYAVVVEDDSLLPRINKNDLVIVDTNAEIESGDTVHFKLNSVCGVRKAFINDNSVLLLDINDTEAPIQTDIDEVSLHKCVGFIGRF